MDPHIRSATERFRAAVNNKRDTGEWTEQNNDNVVEIPKSCNVIYASSVTKREPEQPYYKC